MAGRDLVAARVALQHWLKGRLPGATDVTISQLEYPPSGLSAEHLMFDAEWRKGDEFSRRSLVARVAPSPGDELFPGRDFAGQFRLLRALRRISDLPVPAALWIEEDTDVLGQEFFVMDRAPGRDAQPEHALVGSLDERGRSQVWWSGITMLARIHAIDWQALPTELFASSPALPDLGDDLAYYRGLFEGTDCDGPLPATQDAFQWLAESMPAQEHRALLWGDARLGNLLFDDSLHCRAVLDWEMWSVGDPAMDLAWWLFCDGDARAADSGALFPTDAATCARYVTLTGHPLEHLQYYRVYAALRVSVIVVRLSHLARRRGTPLPLPNIGEQRLAAALR